MTRLQRFLALTFCPAIIVGAYTWATFHYANAGTPWGFLILVTVVTLFIGFATALADWHDN